MRKLFVGLLIGLILAAGLLSPAPTYAAPASIPASPGDAKIRILNWTTGQLLLTCTTATSPCSITLTSGVTYEFLFNEANDVSVDDLAGEPIHNGSPSDFTGRQQAFVVWTEPPVGNPCTYYDNGTLWQTTCHSGGIDGKPAAIALVGTATASADSNFVFGRVTVSGVTKTVRVNYSTN